MRRRCECILACCLALLVVVRVSADESLLQITPPGTVPPGTAPSGITRWMVNDPNSDTVTGEGASATSRPVVKGDKATTAPTASHGTSFGHDAAPDATQPRPIQSVVPTSVGTAAPASDLPMGGLGAVGGLSSPFSTDSQPEPPDVDATYDRVLDLFPDGNDRNLIQRVRKAVEQTEIGIDTTEEEWVTVRGGKRITWGGRVETDTVSWVRDKEFGGQQNYVEFRRLRVLATGEGYGIYDYQLELEFSPEFEGAGPSGVAGDEFGVEIKDAYIGIREVPVLGYTLIGHFRTPIGLSSLTSTRFNPFMERSLPNRLLPGRELGIAAFNRAPQLNMTWGVGAFFDDLDESKRSIIDDNQGARVIGRVTYTPFYDEESFGRCLLHTGFGYAYTRPRLRDDPDGMNPPRRPVGFTARPEIHQGDPLISTGVIDTQQFHLMNFELAWAKGPFTIQSEATYAQLDRADGNSSHVWGSYVYGSWFLTGERRPYDRNFAVFRRVTPHENFWMVPTPHGTQAGLGAWEMAVRWSQLNFVDVNDQYLHNLTAGLNWYWNPHSRLMINWIHPLARNSREGTGVNSDGDILAARLQIDF